MVNKNILGTNDTVSSPLHSSRIIIIREHLEIISLIKQPDLLEHSFTQG